MSAASRLPDHPQRLTSAEYLAFERASAEGKHELVDGVLRPLRRGSASQAGVQAGVQATTGASVAHHRIVANLAGLLYAQLRGGRCEAFYGDLRVRAGRDYLYPDVAGICGAPHLEDERGDTLLDPLVVVEVLSPSTESFDRGGKFAAYRRVESLQEYVLVAQDAMRVERYRREGVGWLLTEHQGPEAELPLDALGARVPLGELYARVELPTSEADGSGSAAEPAGRG